MSEPAEVISWETVRDLAAAIAMDRARRGVLTEQQVCDALDEAYRAGREDRWGDQ